MKKTAATLQIQGAIAVPDIPDDEMMEITESIGAGITEMLDFLLHDRKAMVQVALIGGQIEIEIEDEEDADEATGGDHPGEIQEDEIREPSDEELAEWIHPNG